MKIRTVGSELFHADRRKNRPEGIKFHENPYSGIRVVPCGKTEEQAGGRAGREYGRSADRHDETSIRLSQFTNAPKN